MKHSRLKFCIFTILLLAVAILCGRFTFGSAWEGIYLLKGNSGKLFELKNDLALRDYERLVARMEFQALYERWRSKEKAAQGHSYLKYRWDRINGNGYFINFFPDGTKLLACFGGYIDDSNNPIKGIFTGGGLPKSHYENSSLKTKETGVAFFDGNMWHHLGLNNEEAISPASDPSLRIKPGKWEFLGSKVLFASQFRLAIKSSHLAKIGPVPVRIDRYLIYHAGDRFFTLANRLTNVGTAPLDYYYTYDGKPLQVNFGSLAKNTELARDNSRSLLPGRAGTMVLTMCIEGNDQKTELQCKPKVNLDPLELQYFLDH